MTVTATTMKALFPEFTAQLDARIEVFIDYAELEVCTTRWGDFSDKGISYLAAHFLSLAITAAASGGTGGGGGPLSGKSIGDVSLSFARSSSGGSSGDYFNQTSYGQEYYRMMMRIGMGAVVMTDE